VKTSAPPRFTLRSAASRPAAGAPPLAAAEIHDFRQIILPHLDAAYDLARYLTRDAVLSDDVVQDAVLRAFRAFPQYGGGSARAWLLAIVRNCCRTAQARRTVVMSLVIEESSLGEEAFAQIDRAADPGPTPEEEMFRKSDVDRVRNALKAIPEPFCEAVVLRDLENLSYAEIAQVTGVPIGTVMSRLSRGRGMLARELLPASNDGSEQSRSVK
jgi:RNA polymerase sigma-70 factor (ECF subfamily)